MDIWISIVVTFVLVLVNGYFSMSEMALVNARHVLLQHDADLSAAEVAEKVGLSQSPCWRRINRMQEEGLIERRQGSGSYVAELHPISNLLQVRDQTPDQPYDDALARQSLRQESRRSSHTGSPYRYRHSSRSPRRWQPDAAVRCNERSASR